MTAPNRRYLRFSLLTMFVAMTAVAAWLEYHLNWLRQREAALDRRDPFWCNIVVGQSFGDSAAYGGPDAPGPITPGNLDAPWSLRLLGG